MAGAEIAAPRKIAIAGLPLLDAAAYGNVAAKGRMVHQALAEMKIEPKELAIVPADGNSYQMITIKNLGLQILVSDIVDEDILLSARVHPLSLRESASLAFLRSHCEVKSLATRGDKWLTKMRSFIINARIQTNNLAAGPAGVR